MRPWDGWWRLISFDVPTTENRKRDQLRYYLRSRWFGLLQRSLWISPDPVDTEIRLLRKSDVDAKSLILLKAQACGGESHDELVFAAWNFVRLNELYATHINILNKRPVRKVRDKTEGGALMRWAQREHAAWTNAIKTDPLLPAALLPPGYLGRRAWERRIEVFDLVGNSIRNVLP